MSGLDPSSYFDALGVSLQGASSAAAEALPALKEFYGKQLWHEFSTGILALIQAEPATVGVAAYDVHEVLLVPVRSNLDGSVYTRLLFYACAALGQEQQQLGGGADAAAASSSAAGPSSSSDGNGDGNKKVTALLDSAVASLMANGLTQCVSAVHCLKALVLMAHGPSLEAKALLSKVSDAIGATAVHEILPVLQALYYRATARQSELLCDYDEFYKGAFAFQRYGDLAGLPLAGGELEAVAYKTAVAALLATKVYGFGELVNTSAFVDALDNSAEHKWAIDLIRTASRGDVPGYESFVSANGALIESMPDLADAVNSERLARKVRLMSLLHLIFHTPADKRVLSFKTVAERCSVAPAAVEPLLLTALAQHLIEGTIDELDETVEVTWVLPRVMGTEEIAALARDIASWRRVVKDTAATVGRLSAKITN